MKISLKLLAALIIIISIFVGLKFINHINSAKTEDKISSSGISQLYPPENIPLDIVWENENMLVVNKPSGMLTHPTDKEHTGTLVNALLYKYGNNLSDVDGADKRGIVHRLDRDTSGLLMVAKNNKTHRYLKDQIQRRLVVKKYLAIVNGIVEKDFGIILLPVGKDPQVQYKMAVVKNGKPSLTEYRVLKRFKNYTYLELNLKTGRTHQIRVHLSHLNHPVLNDTFYGTKNFDIKPKGQALQSYKLEFTKPFSHDRIKLEIKPDEKITKALKIIETQQEESK